MSFSMSERLNHFKSSHWPKECLFLWVRDWIISSLLFDENMSSSMIKRLNHFKSTYILKEGVFLWVREWIISSLLIDLKYVFFYQ